MKRLFLLMLGALMLPGCAATRSQLVATWEPEPDVYVSYRLDLGLASPMGERSH